MNALMWAAVVYVAVVVVVMLLVAHAHPDHRRARARSVAPQSPDLPSESSAAIPDLFAREPGRRGAQPQAPHSLSLDCTACAGRFCRHARR